ncbi:polysaccharide deacetylase [Paraburkholderia kururiensis]|uniref:Polysaccharide deacetylase n=1 Tax=Paraburkholderia kururiensis TaxID=984307 RepID=A0ABZ0WUP7_9BURK|nr:polysaccharide deacetylase [Paraburkholderia kururiensis]WQD81128.1 polysaccharide deacetylase [Paraburkholderia kururiensis]
MIGVLFPAPSDEAGRLVLAALRRSVSSAQANWLSYAALRERAPAVIVAIDVPDAWGAALVEWVASSRSKLVVFGRLPAALARYLGCEERAWPEPLASAARSAPAASREAAESDASVRYTALSATLGGRAWVRPFERFDFTDEWNNLGFGAIRADGSIWAVRQPIDVPEEARLASVHVGAERQFSYAGLWDKATASVLWFNRPVGPCDSFEWRLIENFLSAHRAGELHCQPVLSEIPWGYDAAITSRLDCDEDVESARPLWQTYRRLGVPFSLAVHTSNLADTTHHAILRELAADRDAALLSHTATHAPNWGGSYEAACVEGGESMRLLQSVIGKPVRYAVSPFHQSPPYALEALSDCGYSGCVGGIIRNDPEFVLARGGTLAGMPEGFIGHSQQTMLHGDCMLASGDPLAVFKQAFDLAFETKTLFGYLDHPFSARYQYGWPNEPVRIDAHEKLIAYIAGRASKPVFLNEETALDFLLAKSSLRVIEEDGTFRVQLPGEPGTALRFAVEFRGESFEVDPEGRLR